MTYPSGVRPGPGQGKACVYVLQRRDRKRFKLGWSRWPMDRARQLPEFRRGELDLDASRAVWLPSRPRAEQVERSMHKTLAPYHRPAEHHGDGWQEWFDGVMAEPALRILSHMPLDETSSRTARVVPISLPRPPADAVSVETGTQDVWWRVEDVLARLGVECAVSVVGNDGHRVTVHGFWCAQKLAQDVRAAAKDPETFQSWREGRPFNFVRLIDRQGDDLVLEFMPLTRIETWEEGPTLVWQVKGFLESLKRRSRIRVER